jgi:hypothetical protein
MSAITNPTRSTVTAAPRPLWQVGLLTIVAAVLVNLLALPLLVAGLNLPRDFQLFQPAPIGVVTAIGVLGAVIAFALVRRFSARPARTYWIVVVGALIVSILPNLSIIAGLADPAAFPFPNFTALNAAALSVFHVLAALVAGYLLTTLGLPRRNP